MIATTDKKRRKLYLAFALAFLALEILLVAFVDKPVALWARELQTSHLALIDFFRAYTDLGKGKWYAWPSGLATLLCLALGFLPEMREKTRQTLREAGARVGFFFIATSAAGLVTDAIKPLVGRARPKFLNESGFYGFEPFTFNGDWASLPSGHSTTAFAVAFAVSALFPRARGAMFVFAFLLALSRIMVNAHFLADVVAGALVAGLTVFVTKRLFFRFRIFQAQTCNCCNCEEDSTKKR